MLVEAMRMTDINHVVSDACQPTSCYKRHDPQKNDLAPVSETEIPGLPFEINTRGVGLSGLLLLEKYHESGRTNTNT